MPPRAPQHQPQVQVPHHRIFPYSVVISTRSSKKSGNSTLYVLLTRLKIRSSIKLPRCSKIRCESWRMKSADLTNWLRSLSTGKR